MRARTAEEFDDSLYHELAWRRVEMHRLRSEIESAYGVTQEMLLRAGVALLYAHWEGFVRSATGSYVEFVNRRGLRRGQLRECFAAVGSRRLLRHGAESGFKELVGICRRLADPGDQVRLVPDDFVRTGGNLGWDSFEGILKAVGLSPGPYESKAHLLDYGLVATRNSVAHGRYQNQDLQGFYELHDGVDEMIMVLRNQLSNAVHLQEYRS